MDGFREAALDAGYRGQEAEQVARQLEEDERERAYAREEDRQASDVTFLEQLGYEPPQPESWRRCRPRVRLS